MLKPWTSGGITSANHPACLAAVVPGIWRCTSPRCVCVRVLPAQRVGVCYFFLRADSHDRSCAWCRILVFVFVFLKPRRASVPEWFSRFTCRWPPGSPGCVWCRGSVLPGRVWAAWNDPAPRSGPSACTCPAGAKMWGERWKGCSRVTSGLNGGNITGISTRRGQALRLWCNVL